MSFPVTIVAKGKHAILYALAKKFGSASALAREIGTNPSLLGRWMNLQEFPRLSPTDRHGQPRKLHPKRAAVIRRLEELTMMPAEELFPDYVRDQLGDIVTSIEYTAELENNAIEHTGRMTLPGPAESAGKLELREDVMSVVESLPYREREIIKLRYGLNESGHTYSLEEVGHIFKVTRDRIRQLEARAIRRMQQPERAAQIVDHIG